MPRRGKLTPKRFWDQLDALDRLADLKGARFDGDTPERRLRRKAESVLLPERFNRHYLPHYFRDEGSPFHALLYLALERDSRIAARAPRGNAKSTVGTFSYSLHQVVCAEVLKALDDGTLAESDPELASMIEQVQGEIAEQRLAGLDDLLKGIPEHWDPGYQAELEAWVAELVAGLQAEPRVRTHWDPYIQIVAVSIDVSEEFTSAIRAELERNPLIQADWGDLTPVRHGDWNRRHKRAAADADWESNGVRVRAFGMDGDLRGGKHGEWRPTLAIFDDPDSERTVRTPKQRDAAATKVGRAVNYGLEPSKARVFQLGTPLHGDCLVCRYTEHDQYKARWTALRFRSRDEHGTILYPAKWTHERLDEEELEDPESYASELDDRPPSDDSKPFKELHYYSREAWEHVPLPKVMAFDPSYGKTRTSDYSAIVVLRGPTPDGRILIHRVELLRIGDPEALVETVNAIYEEEQPDAAIIEAIALGHILESLSTSRGARAGIFPAWLRIERQELAKDLRIRGLAPLVNSGRMPFPDDGSCRGLERQARDYPDGKVDGLDATEMGLRLVRQQARGASARQVRHQPSRRAFLRRGAF